MWASQDNFTTKGFLELQVFPITENWKSVLERGCPGTSFREACDDVRRRNKLASFSLLSAMKVTAGVCRIVPLLSVHVRIERDL